MLCNQEVNTVLLTRLCLSIAKFSIVIGSSGAYLSRNRCVITWVSNYRCPIFELFVIGYPRDFHVNYLHFKGFLRQLRAL